MTPKQGRELNKNLRAKFDAMNHPRQEIHRYFIPEGYKYRNLQTHFKDITDPDEFLAEMTKLVKLAKKLGAEICLKYKPYRHREDSGGRGLRPAENGMCLRSMRYETDKEFNKRIASDREWYVEKERSKIRAKERDFAKGNALAKLTPKERKLLGIRG